MSLFVNVHCPHDSVSPFEYPSLGHKGEKFFGFEKCGNDFSLSLILREGCVFAVDDIFGFLISIHILDTPGCL